DRRILAALDPRLISLQTPSSYEAYLRKALTGKASISRPFSGELAVSQYTNRPTMFVGAPVISAEGKVGAVLALRLKPEEEFSRIFAMARLGETGESYAFDRRGVMLTPSRFDFELRKLGLIPKKREATSMLNLRLIDPGVDLEHNRPRTQISAEPQ